VRDAAFTRNRARAGWRRVLKHRVINGESGMDAEPGVNPSE